MIQADTIHRFVLGVRTSGNTKSKRQRADDAARFKRTKVVEGVSSTASPPHCKPAKKLVSQRLCLGDGTKSAIGNLLCVQLHCVLGELEALLNHGSELPDPPALRA